MLTHHCFFHSELSPFFESSFSVLVIQLKRNPLFFLFTRLRQWHYIAEKPEAADFAIAVITWFCSQKSLWGQEVIDAFPVLAHHYRSIRDSIPAATQTFDEMDTWEAYYVI